MRGYIFSFKLGNKWEDILSNLKKRGRWFMRCAVYVRVSTDDQRDNGYSIDSQLRMIKEYCEKMIIVL